LIFISTENLEKGETPDSKILARPYVQRLQMSKLTKPAAVHRYHNLEDKTPSLRFVQNSALVAHFLQVHDIKSRGTLVKHVEIQFPHPRPYNMQALESLVNTSHSLAEYCKIKRDVSRELVCLKEARNKILQECEDTKRTSMTPAHLKTFADTLTAELLHLHREDACTMDGIKFETTPP
jgi:hypothetical protein